MTRPPIQSTANSSDSKDLQIALNDTLRANYEFMDDNSISFLKNLDVEIKDIEVIVPDPRSQVLDADMQNGWNGFIDGKPGVGARWFQMYDGTIHLSARMRNGAIGSAAFSVPEAIAPTQEMRLACQSSGAFAMARITTSGVVIPSVGATTDFCIETSWVPSRNYHQPLSCFPIDVKTRYKTPPLAVLALFNRKEPYSPVEITNVALTPSWTFKDGIVQILDITGLEYNKRQVVKIMIIGG